MMKVQQEKPKVSISIRKLDRLETTQLRCWCGN
jgi:hypothetical protein